MVMMVFGDQERREVMSMTDSALQCSVNNIERSSESPQQRAALMVPVANNRGATHLQFLKLFPVESNPVLVEMKNKRHNDFQLILVFNMHKS